MMTLNVTMPMAAALAVLAAGPAPAQLNYPTKSIRLVNPYLPGGTPDILHRAIAHKLTETLGQQVILDSRPGAGGNIGTDIVAKSPPDGYTIVVAAVSPFGVNPTLYGAKMPFDPLRDFEPIVSTAKVPLILDVHPSLPVRSIKELVALARARPGQMSYGSAGNGTSNHLVMEMFKAAAAVNILHVPYRGTAQSLVALLGGELEMIMGQIPSTLPHIRAGKVRALALSGAKRNPVVADVPTFMEAGVAGLEATSWYGIAAPAGTPREIILKLNAAINKALVSPDLRSRFLAEGADVDGGTPEQFAAFIRAELPKWAVAVKSSGAKVD